MSVARAQAEISSYEYTEWIAFFQLKQEATGVKETEKATNAADMKNMLMMHAKINNGMLKNG